MAIKQATLSVTTASGVGSKQDSISRSGKVLAIGYKFSGSAPATIDTVVTAVDPSGRAPDVPIDSLTDTNTSQWRYPRKTSTIADEANIVLADYTLKVTCAGGGDVTDAVKVTVLYE